MRSWKHLLSRVGPRRGIETVGGLYVVLAVLRAGVGLGSGASVLNVAIIALLISTPGFVLLVGGYRLPRRDIDPRFYPDIAGWTAAGFAAMGSVLLIYHLQPEGAVSSPATSPPILTALSSVAGFAVGIHDAEAKTRAHVLEQRNRELQQIRTELEGTVDKLAESEQRYRTLTENFPNGAVALLDEDLRHTLVAGKGFENLDFSAEDLRNERIDDVYSGEILDEIESHYRATLEGEATSFELAVQGRVFEFRTHPLTDDDGDVYAILAMSQDITEHKRRERELTKQARQQEVVADLGQLALETDDLDELMHEAARQVAVVLDNEYCKVLDLDAEREELLLRQGVGWADGLVGEATVSAVEADSQAAYTLQSNRPVVVDDLETETRFSGPALLRRHDVRSGISTIIGPVDDPWGVLGTHDTDNKRFADEDVNFVQSVANVLAEAIERRQYQSELETLIADLEESNKRLEQFAYAASHDLQEPLRMVSSYLQLIERRYGDDLDRDGEEFLAYAVDGADRMREMIDGLLQYSRVETRGDEFEQVDLEAVLEDVRENLRVQIEESDAEITVESLPRVEGDEGQLQQVFQNLLSNAIEYSGDERPRIRVSAERNGRRWTVAVADDGIGIEPNGQDRIFEVFQRLHSRDEHSGTGIGLALCERIVERHGGEIWVDSEPGEGATFSFTLPAVDDEDEDSIGVSGYSVNRNNR